jgi:phage terminase large subunit GpA-like protein
MPTKKMKLNNGEAHLVKPSEGENQLSRWLSEQLSYLKIVITTTESMSLKVTAFMKLAQMGKVEDIKKVIYAVKLNNIIAQMQNQTYINKI